MQRITHNGVQLWPRPKRNSIGRYRRSYRGFALTLFVIAAFLLFTLFAPAFSAWLDKANTPLTYIAPPPVYASVTMESKVEELKESILDRLAACESAGKKEADGIVVLDTNGKGSYGPFQWQRTSVMHYYEKKNGKPINGRDAIILALNGEQARDLARYVIFDTNSGVEKDWVNCSKKLGLQSEVDIIQKLTK